MQKIKLNYEHAETDIKFAKLNKRNSLKEYKEEVKQGEYDRETVIVRQFIYVDNKEFEELSNSFLHDKKDVWECIGGASISDGMMDKHGIDKNAEYINFSEQQREIFKKHYRLETTKVINIDTGEVFYVNTEGYDYARYVGIQ